MGTWDVTFCAYFQYFRCRNELPCFLCEISTFLNHITLQMFWLEPSESAISAELAAKLLQTLLNVLLLQSMHETPHAFIMIVKRIDFLLDWLIDGNKN